MDRTKLNINFPVVGPVPTGEPEEKVYTVPEWTLTAKRFLVAIATGLILILAFRGCEGWLDVADGNQRRVPLMERLDK